MTQTSENIEKLFKTLNDTLFSLRIQFDKMVKEIDAKDEEIETLESEATLNQGKVVDSEIQCGIGNIEYVEPGNIALVDIMENLDAAIQKTNFRKVNEVLCSIS